MFALVLPLLCPVSAGGESGLAGEDLERRLFEDLDFACRLQEVLARPSLTVSGLSAALGVGGPSAPRFDGRFDGLMFRLERRVGVGDCRILLSAFEGARDWHVFRARVFFDTDGDVEGLESDFVVRRFNDQVRGAWQVPCKDIERGFVLDWHDAALARQREAHFSALFGGFGGPDVPEELQWAYGFLSSPFRDLLFVPEDAQVSFSAVAESIELLVRLERWDLLRRLSRGINPASRIYAIRALQRHAQMLPEDEQVLSDLRETITPILYTEGGCIVHYTTAEALLDRPSAFADRRLKKNWCKRAVELGKQRFDELGCRPRSGPVGAGPELGRW
jgi:hypothetical protein